MEIIICDTETTHYRPELAHVVEIGAVVLDLKTGEFGESFESLANPGIRHLLHADEALSVNGLTREEILSAPKDIDVAQQFRDWLEKHSYPLVGYNSNYYDSLVLSKAPWGIPMDSWDHDMDVMLLAYGAMKEQDPCPLEWMAWKEEYKWPRLDEAARYYGVLKVEQDHRALSDCMITGRLLLQLMEVE